MIIEIPLNPITKQRIEQRIAEENYIMSLRAVTLLDENDIRQSIKDLTLPQRELLKLALSLGDFSSGVKHFKWKYLNNTYALMTGGKYGDLSYFLIESQITQVRIVFDSLFNLSKLAIASGRI